MWVLMLAAVNLIPSQTTKLLHTESCVTSSKGSDNIGKLIFLANFKAPLPTNKQWGVSSITFRASVTGFSISTTQPTAPNRKGYLAIMNNNTNNIIKLVYLKSDSHIYFILFSLLLYLLQWKRFKNDEKCFLFHLKSFFPSQDI